MQIREFVSSLGIEFERMRGFYQFVKASEDVQAQKEIVIFGRESGDAFVGPAARELLRLPSDEGSTREALRAAGCFCCVYPIDEREQGAARWERVSL